MHAPHSDDGETQATWDDAALPDTPPLTENVRCDVCIIGAGFSGLSVAYELAALGKSVVVIDAAGLASGQTSRTSAHLASALDDRFTRLEQLHGATGAQVAAESHRAAIDRIEAIVRTENIDCGFRRVDGYLFTDPEHDAADLAQELEATERAGLPAQAVAGAPLPFRTGPAIRYPDQAIFHPLQYLAALATKLIARGVRIHGQTRAVEVNGGVDGRVTTENGCQISAGAIVVATNSPINELAVIHTKQAAYRSYMIAYEIPAGTVTNALYWDMGDPYHYLRVVPGAEVDLLLVGGEDHKTGQEQAPEERWARLRAWTRERFGQLGREVRCWSGQLMEPVDGPAFIGKSPLDANNVFVVTGDSGHGLTHGVIAGLLLTALIEGRDHPWASLYEPKRRSLRAIADYAKENLNVAAQYADWLKAGEVEEIGQIARGEGALMRRGTSILAVYVDDAGVPTACSAACPHLGGVVRWNRAEKTWDCPCHGSRFAHDGAVVAGPAVSGLTPAVLDGDRAAEGRGDEAEALAMAEIKAVGVA